VEPDYLLYSEVLPHWTLVHNGAEIPPIFLSLGEATTIFMSLPLVGLGALPLKLKK